LIIKIEFENTKITLSVGAEGVTIDAPDPVEQETRQTTLSDAQWAAYAQGREDERNHIKSRLVTAEKEARATMGEPLGELLKDEFPDFDQLVEHDDKQYDSFGCCMACEVVPCACRTLGGIHGENNLPPKVDPVTGNIAGWVKTYRTERRKRALEAQPRAVCVSSCCGTEGARTRDGSCWGCR